MYMLVWSETNKIQLVVLQEERKRTGRYIAAGTAIFLSLLGVYQALVRGTPEYAALFAPALIMFVYVLWILYASKHYRKNFLVSLLYVHIPITKTVVVDSSLNVLVK